MMDVMERILAIPGNSEANVGVGASDRVMKLDGVEFDGAWVDNPAYFQRHHDTRVLECLRVCWLEISGAIPNVPAGKWEAILHTRCDNARFNAEWKVFAEGEEDNACSFTTHRSGGAGSELLQSYQRQWVRLSFGVLNLNRSSTVRFSIFGNNPWWCYGIHFGDLELRACGIEWEKERLLLLCLLRKANDVEGACMLQELPREIIGLIAKMLITPLPEEVSRPGSLLRRDGER